MNKLTPGEITKAVEKIRKRYDEYVYKFFKPSRLKKAFEDRYVRALKSDIDVSSFLLAEVGAIEELIKREEDRVVASVRPDESRESISAKVDRVVEENRQKILKYPAIRFHKDADEEVCHLLGALNHLERMYWEPLVKVLRDTAYARSSLTLSNLESQLHFLGGLDEDRTSSSLSRYFYHLNQFPRNYPSIDREAKEFILESAFFLHDLNEIMARVKANYSQLDEGVLAELTTIQDFVLGVIRDFRVKDLKRKK